jgi:transcriptional regulatory protein RtcR
MPKKLVVFGLLGPVLDGGRGAKRWEKWRPTVSICQHDDLLVSRFELLYQKKFEKIGNQTIEDITSVSPETTVNHHPVEFTDAWDFEEVYNQLYEFVSSYPFDPDNEEYLVHITTGTHVAQICLFLLTEARYFPARLLQTQPPGKRENLPGSYTIIDLDLSRYDKIAARLNEQQELELSALKSGIDTRNEEFNWLIERIEFVAHRSRAPMLLSGPTGAGKSQLARRIYELKKKHHLLSGAFVEVNCATIRGDAAMSALFGHTKGSFTGALQARKGLLLEANQGLLFLDEIGELGLDEQAMLLRALEDGTFLPVGSDRPVKSNFQLIAATNRDLQKQVRCGAFREDLLARINLWEFALPGLAERREDIEPNIDFELHRCSQELGKKISFNREGLQSFLRFATGKAASWNANFRDLSAAISRMATLAPEGRIRVSEVREESGRLLTKWKTLDGEVDTTHKESIAVPLLPSLLDEKELAGLDTFDRLQLESVLQVCSKHTSLAEAGRTLFEVSRTKRKTINDADRLSKYLGRYGITWKDIGNFTSNTS